jgi:hypothetical protein
MNILVGFRTYISAGVVIAHQKTGGFMKKLVAMFLVLFTIFGVGISQAGDAILSWDAPTANEDGSVPAVVTGYKVYTRTGATYANGGVDVGNVLTRTITGLPAGTWYFVVTAYNSSGESVFSNEVSKIIIQSKPNPPTGCRVQ